MNQLIVVLFTALGTGAVSINLRSQVVIAAWVIKTAMVAEFLKHLVFLHDSACASFRVMVARTFAIPLDGTSFRQDPSIVRRAKRGSLILALTLPSSACAKPITTGEDRAEEKSSFLLEITQKNPIASQGQIFYNRGER